MDLILDGKISKEGTIIDVNIGIEDGRIKEIKKNIIGAKTKKIEGLIIPAMLDLHVHFREPGYTYKEDFETGSLSALFGGVSFVMDMPNTKPVTDNKEAFDEKKRLASAKSYIDFGLFAAVSERYNEYFVKEVPAFKLYMSETTGINPENLEVLLNNTSKISTEKIIFVHSELKSEFRQGIARNLREHSLIRSESSEINAVRLLISKNLKNMHITHVSSPDTIPYAIGANYTTDVTPHHLFLDFSSNLKANAKTNPPVRSKHNAEQLWNLLINDNIDFVASDHAPHTIDEKEKDFEYAPAGVPNVETTLPLFLERYKEGMISIERVIDVLSRTPAKLLNLRKGSIEPGFDADLIAFRISDARKIDSSKLHYKCGWSPYEGLNAIFPHTVIVRGEFKIENFDLEASAGSGKYYYGNHNNI